MALFLAAFPPTLSGQVLFEWPVRSDVGPEAVLTGAPALLWNPAGAAPAVDSARQVWVVHVDGPETSGIQGLAGAVVLDLPWAGRLGAAYQHLGVPDIARTTTSPEPEPGSFTVAEDLLVLGLARSVSEVGGLGVSLRLMRGTVGSDRRDRAAVDVGGQVGLGGAVAPRFGAVVRSVGTRADLVAGVDGAVPLPTPRLGLRLGYGLQAPLSRFDAEHRLSARAVWDGTLVVGAGALNHPDGSWASLFEVRLLVGRYGLGVVRERLPNGFGATHFFQATIGLN